MTQLTKECLRSYQIIKELSTNRQYVAVVSLLQHDYLMKIQYEEDYPEDYLYYEADKLKKVTEIFEDDSIGPRYVESWSCKGHRYLIQEYWTDAMMLYETDFDYKLLEQIFILIRRIHIKGVIHGDLYPANIIISNGKIGIIDWELSSFDNKSLESVNYEINFFYRFLTDHKPKHIIEKINQLMFQYYGIKKN